MDDFKVSTWAVGELKKEHEKPFFIAYGLFRPHLPWYAPKKYFDLYPVDKIKLPTIDANDLEDVPPLGQRMARPQGDHKKVTESDNWRRAVQGYLASISFADAQLGRVLDALDASPYRGNTVIVLWGDHGWHLGEKLHWRKFTLWEEATKAPLMFVAPGVTKPGGRSHRTVDFMDIYPTLVELCGLPERKELEGKSIVPLLKDPSAEWNRPALTTHGRENHTIRTERWRYIRYRDGGEELYDHDVDPLEWKNLAEDSKYDKVKEELAAWLPKKNVPDAPSGNRRRKK